MVTGMQRKGLFAPKGVLMTADAVAEVGVRGMFRGRTVVIAGLANAAGAMATRFAPRSVVAAVTGLMFKPRGKPSH